MASLAEEIRELKAEIAEYKAKLKAATTEAGEERYANLIIASRNNLTALLQQLQPQAQASGGGQAAQAWGGQADSLRLNELVLEEAIVKTNVAGRAASDFAADKDVKFNGVGLMSHLVCYDSTLIDHTHERQLSATALFHPSKELLESKDVVDLSLMLFSVTICNYDLSKVSEELKDRSSNTRSVQTHHLDICKKYFPSYMFHTSTQKNSNISMKNLSCALGVASALSLPDGVGVDRNNVARMIWEVKHNVSTPAVALRQAISEGTNVGWGQLRRGVKWSDIYVPLIGSNGYLIQFAVLVFLKPGFPYSFMLSKVLDLTDPRDRLLAAGHLLKVFQFIATELCEGTVISDEECTERLMGLDKNIYHLKSHKDFFCCKCDVDASLLHLFGVMSAIFTDENCRNNVLFPLCIRQANQEFDLVFLKLKEYNIGLPDCPFLRGNLLKSVRTVLGCIHECGVAHLDLYPSNIMWKKENDSNEVHVMIIDWDSAHFVDEILHEDVTVRLRSRKVLADNFAKAAKRATNLFDYDLSLLYVLESHLNNSTLQVSDKNKLDDAFFSLVNSFSMQS